MASQPVWQSHPSITDVDDDRDRTNSISSHVVRCVYDGRRAVVVAGEAGAKTQIASLLDLLDLHLNGDGGRLKSPVNSNEVALLLAGRPSDHLEAIDALRTLIASLRGPNIPRVLLLEHAADGDWAPPDADIWEKGDPSYYKTWPGLLAGVADEPPHLVTELIRRAGRPELRAYPMLTNRGYWSIRLEGLEVGRLNAAGGSLSVGKDREGRQSLPRRAWVSAQGGHSDPLAVHDETSSIEKAVEVVQTFADLWSPASAADSMTALLQNEHALESRILRGHVPVEIEGQTLELLRPHESVNWGSQFPTKWGRDGSARFLDALLKEGRTPWAVEMKVKGGGGGGQYYRHAIAQAVLYREFIRAATPLHPWFKDRQLDASTCEAAVVVPALSGGHAPRAPRLIRLCEAFDVKLVEVPHEAAEVKWPVSLAVEGELVGLTESEAPLSTR